MNIKPKVYTKLINFKISPEEYELLRVISEEEKKTFSELFRDFIHDHEIGKSYIEYKNELSQAHWEKMDEEYIDWSFDPT